MTAKYYFNTGATVFSGGAINTSAAASHVSYTYDALGRQIEVKEFSGTSTTPSRDTVTTYDPVTQKVASITSPEGTINYAYDEKTGRKTETWTGTDHSTSPNDTVYGYDPQGRLTTPTGTTYYEYDLRNRMIAVDANGDDLAYDSVTGSTSGTVNDTVDSTYG